MYSIRQKFLNGQVTTNLTELDSPNKRSETFEISLYMNQQTPAFKRPGSNIYKWTILRNDEDRWKFFCLSGYDS